MFFFRECISYFTVRSFHGLVSPKNCNKLPGCSQFPPVQFAASAPVGNAGGGLPLGNEEMPGKDGVSIGVGGSARLVLFDRLGKELLREPPGKPLSEVYKTSE